MLPHPLSKFGQPLRLAPGFRFPSPLGSLEVPELELPPLAFPKLDERTDQALRYALGADLSGLIALVPAVGDALADVIRDMHRAEIKRILTADEFHSFVQNTKLGPDTLAMIRLLLKQAGKGFGPGGAT